MSSNEELPSEAKCGKILVDKLLKQHHYGPFEHAQIVFNVGYAPHDTVMQLRTHRTGISFDVQSFRYTSKAFLDLAAMELITASDGSYDSNLVRQVNKVFYVPPVGTYTNRQGTLYTITPEDRFEIAADCYRSAQRYAHYIEKGFSEESARRVIAMGARQSFVVSLNMRTLMHLVCMRTAKDVQLEARMVLAHFTSHALDWAPDVFEYVVEKMYGKSILAP
jgi:thymidylate synthase (FAD)